MAPAATKSITPYPVLSFWEKLLILRAISLTLGRTILRLITSIYRGRNGAPSVMRDVRKYMVRLQINTLSRRQLQVLGGTAPQTIEAFCKKNNWSIRETIELPGDQGGRIFFLGEKRPNVLAYYHGGGYVLPLGVYHLQFLKDVYDKTPHLGIAVLEYSLSPQSHYPVQLQQGIASVSYLLSNGYAPGQVMVAGDSAGAQLSLGILSAISHPPPFKTPSVPTLSAPLAGAVLLYPWTCFDLYSSSMTTNNGKDLLTHHALREWSAAFLGSNNKPDYYNSPAYAPSSFWSNLPVSRVLVPYGGLELFRDDIRKLVVQMKAAGVKVEDWEAEGLEHNGALMDYETTGKASDWAEKIIGWMGGAVSS